MSSTRLITRRFLLLSLLSLILLFFLCPIPTAAFRTNDTDFIRTRCGTTLYPKLCYSSLARYSSAVQSDPAQLAKVAIGVSLARAQRMAAYVSNISRQADYGDDPRAAAALHDCFSTFGDAVDGIRDSLKQMRHLDPTGSRGGSFQFHMSNVQTWMSAAITNEDTCTDGFEDVADGPLKADMCERVDQVKMVTSNALAFVNSYADSHKASP